MTSADFGGDGDIDLATIGYDDTLTISLSLDARHDRTIMVPDDFPTVQEAVDNAWNLDTILVCPGIYYGSIDFGGKNLVLISSDCSGKAAASGEPDWLSRSLVTILDGGRTGRVLTFDDGEDDRSVVAGFTIQNGYAGGYGGAIFCYDTAAPIIMENIIRSNRSGSVGGGIFVHMGAATIKKNYIISNSCGNWGGGIYAGSGGGLCYKDYGTPVIFCNNIFWLNVSTTGGPQTDFLTDPPPITYSVVQGGWVGNGNIEADPIFADPDNGDFRLSTGSPCIDAGGPDMPLDPDSTVSDIEAFCYLSPLDIEEDDGKSGLPRSFVVSQNYPNPFNMLTTIEYNLPQRTRVTIEIDNVVGQLVGTLIDHQEAAGSHRVIWNGTNTANELFTTGVYFYRFRAGDQVETKKMLLLK